MGDGLLSVLLSALQALGGGGSSSESEPAPPPAAVQPAASGPEKAQEAFDAYLGLARAMVLARDRYVEEVGAAELAEGAKAGMAAALDPWSEYLSAEAMEAWSEASGGVYAGVGVSVSEGEDGAILEDYPEPDSPAFRAGVRMDDRIVAVDGADAASLGFDEAVERIGGEPGTAVELAWVRAEDGAAATARLERASISVPTVQAARRFGPEGALGYVYLAEFEERTPRELRRAVRRLGGARLRGLVLDLRDDPGGDVEAAVACASLFLPPGALVARTRGRLPAEDDHNYRSAGGEAWPGLRVALLVNEETASSAELFAAALRDHGRAPLFGARTFGKALVQTFLEIEGGGGAALKLTTARYYTPSGALVHGAGIEPDFPEPQTAEEAFALVRARLLAVRPDLAAPAVRDRILSVPDRALDAAAAWLLSGDPPPAARPEAPPRIPAPSRKPDPK